MNTFSIRLETDLIRLIDEFANKHDRSRNYVIAKILKEKFNYKLAGEG
jgi:predicted transcriptional regulator